MRDVAGGHIGNVPRVVVAAGAFAEVGRVKEMIPFRIRDHTWIRREDRPTHSPGKDYRLGPRLTVENQGRVVCPSASPLAVLATGPLHQRRAADNDDQYRDLPKLHVCFLP